MGWGGGLWSERGANTSDETQMKVMGDLPVEGPGDVTTDTHIHDDE